MLSGVILQLQHGLFPCAGLSAIAFLQTVGYTGKTDVVTGCALRFGQHRNDLERRRYELTAAELTHIMTAAPPGGMLFAALQAVENDPARLTLEASQRSCDICQRSQQVNGKIACVCLDGIHLPRDREANDSKAKGTLTFSSFHTQIKRCGSACAREFIHGLIRM